MLDLPPSCRSIYTVYSYSNFAVFIRFYLPIVCSAFIAHAGFVVASMRVTAARLAPIAIIYVKFSTHT